MRVAIASDHAGVSLQDTAVAAVRRAGHDPVVLGQASEGDDYPDVALVVGAAIRSGQAQRGIVLCGSGAGVTVAANKIPLVRAALAYDTYTARQMVEHDDVNVLALGARVIGPAVAADVVEAFVGARFSGAARHARRLGKVLAMEATRIRGATADVVARGQRLWLDGVDVRTLQGGVMADLVGDHGVTGGTTAPSQLTSALRAGAYADHLVGDFAPEDSGRGGDPEALALALLLADAAAAADLVEGVHAATLGGDGYVSVDLPPGLVDDVDGTVQAAHRLVELADRPNIMVKVPATRAGHVAARRLIADGIAVHATLVYSAEQCRAACEAYVEGVERRLRADEDPRVGGLLSFSIAPWDVATTERLPESLHHTVGLAAARVVWEAFDVMWADERWKHLADAGAMPQRLAFAGTAAPEPLPATYYVDALEMPGTVLLIDQATLSALEAADRRAVADEQRTRSADLERLREAGISLDVLATRLQHDALRQAAGEWEALLAAARDVMDRS